MQTAATAAAATQAEHRGAPRGSDQVISLLERIRMFGL